MILTPAGESYMMPVARVMSLYRKHTGKQAIEVTRVSDALDMTASRTGRRIFLHVVNTNMARSVNADLQVKGMKITSGRIFEIADDPMREIDETVPNLFRIREKSLQSGGKHAFPAASVSAIELEVEKER